MRICNDGKLDATVGRLLLEPWGLSNNPPHTDRQPTWDEGKFTLPEEGASIWFEQGLWGRGVSLIQLLATKGGPAGSAGR